MAAAATNAASRKSFKDTASACAPARGAAPVCAVSVECVTKQFGTRKAVDEVSFSLPQGAFLSVFGPNGAGKTTLLRMLSTLARPSSGSIHINGIDAKEEPDRAREAVGLISHSPMLYPDLTAEENLLFYAKLYGVREPEKRVLQLLDAVGLKHRRLDRVRTFSRGMTQRVSIARALINDPAVVLLDEPYSGLDPHAVEIFDELIAEQRAGRTFIMVSHDLGKGLSLADHVLLMARGKAVCFSSTRNLNATEFRSLYRSTVGTGVA